MKRLKIVLTFLLTMFASLSTLGATTDNDSVKIFFDFGAIFVHTDYMDNKEELDQAISRIREQQQNGMAISRVTITSSASPEGAEDVNEKIAAARAQSLSDYLTQHVSLDTSCIQVVNRCVDWSELQRLAQADPRISSNRRLLTYINKVVTDINEGRPAANATIKANMQNISKRDYNYMRRHLFPKMRYAKAQVEMTKAAADKVVTAQQAGNASEVTAGYQTATPRMKPSAIPGYYQVGDTIRRTDDALLPGETLISEREVSVNEYYLYPDGTKVPASQYESSHFPTTPTKPTLPTSPKNYYFALKTNLLFDAVAIPNISLEWGFAPHWSISGEYMHAWWKSDVSHKYWRTYGGNLELRYWFGKKAAQKRLSGHHVGIYGGALTYDFEWGGKGYQAHKWSTNFGLSYGYSAPIARRLNLDFELGLGYLSGEYEEYEPKGDYYFWQATKNRKFFGPTRAEVTLVWLLGHGNVNKK